MAKANLTIYHPSGGVEGSAMRVKFYYQTEERPCIVRLSFANQVDGKFDLDDGIDCDMRFDEVSRVISVLRGDSPCVGDGQNAIRIGEGKMFAIKPIEKDGSFVFAACEKDGDRTMKSQITLKRHEAAGLLSVLESSMFFFAFVKGVNP